MCHSLGVECALGATVAGGIGNNTTGGTFGTYWLANPTRCNAGPFSFIGGGFQNRATGACSVVGGGNANVANCTISTIAGGVQNTTAFGYTFIGGGSSNSVSGYMSAVAAGFGNSASGTDSFIGGGRSNVASGCTSAVLGGNGNSATGAYSGAFGCGLTASAACTFYANNFCACGTTSSTNGFWFTGSQAGKMCTGCYYPGGSIQNTWVTVSTFSAYELTSFMLMAGFEQDTADAQNLTATFVDSGTTSYGNGFSPTRLIGSTSLEAQRSGANLQLRVTAASAATGTPILRWMLMKMG